MSPISSQAAAPLRTHAAPPVVLPSRGASDAASVAPPVLTARLEAGPSWPVEGVLRAAEGEGPFALDAAPGAPMAPWRPSARPHWAQAAEAVVALLGHTATLAALLSLGAPLPAAPEAIAVTLVAAGDAVPGTSPDAGGQDGRAASKTPFPAQDSEARPPPDSAAEPTPPHPAAADGGPRPQPESVPPAGVGASAERPPLPSAPPPEPADTAPPPPPSVAAANEPPPAPPPAPPDAPTDAAADPAPSPPPAAAAAKAPPPAEPEAVAPPPAAGPAPAQPPVAVARLEPPATAVERMEPAPPRPQAPPRPKAEAKPPSAPRLKPDAKTRPDAKTDAAERSGLPKAQAVRDTPGRTSAQGAPGGRSGAAGGAPTGAAASRSGYAALVVAEIQAHRFYPESARAHGSEGAVGIAFTIESSGRVASASVVRSSGSSDLDAAARHIVQSIAPPPPPGGSFSASTTIRFHVE